MNVQASYARFPKNYQSFVVDFQTNTTKGDRMREIVYEQIQKVIREGVDDEEVDDAVLMMKKGRAGMVEESGKCPLDGGITLL